LATGLSERLKREGIGFYTISSDEVRREIFAQSRYTPEERDILYTTIAYVAKALVSNGVNVIIDATGNRRTYRDSVRAGVRDFIEVYLRCGIELCMEREAKRIERHGAPARIYERGLTGLSSTVPGLGEPYEEPLDPEVLVRTDKAGVEECVEAIYQALQRRSGTG